MLAVSPGAAAQDADLQENSSGDVEAVAPTTQGGGLVLELGTAEETLAPPPRRQAMPDSDVELITGGEGRDGLARRGRLKRED